MTETTPQPGPDEAPSHGDNTPPEATELKVERQSPNKIKIGQGVRPLFANTFYAWQDGGMVRIVACESTNDTMISPVHTFLVVPDSVCRSLCQSLLALMDGKGSVDDEADNES